MDDAPAIASLPDDPARLKALLIAREDQLAAREQLIAEQQATITTLTQQRDAFYLEKLRLEVRLAKALKQAYQPVEKPHLAVWHRQSCRCFSRADSPCHTSSTGCYGPRADRLSDPGQLLLEFAQRLDQLPIDAADLPEEAQSGGETRSGDVAGPYTSTRREVGIGHFRGITERSRAPI
jgi:hypothetical protein